MIVDGKWLDNITCRRCRMRHPAEITCERAREIAEQGRAETPPTPTPEQRFDRHLEMIDLYDNWDEAKVHVLDALRALWEKR